MRILALPWIALLGASLLGCKPALIPCQKPRLLGFEIEGATRLNPDDQGRSLPTTVVVYQLKARTRFDEADFNRLWKDPKALLQDDLVQADELTISPGERRRLEVERSAQASYLAAVALVREPGSFWRFVLPLPAESQQCTEERTRPPTLGIRVLVEDYEIRALASPSGQGT